MCGGTVPVHFVLFGGAGVVEYSTVEQSAAGVVSGVMRRWDITIVSYLLHGYVTMNIPLSLKNERNPVSSFSHNFLVSGLTMILSKGASHLYTDFPILIVGVFSPVISARNLH